jgi:predicted small integral membrane protein
MNSPAVHTAFYVSIIAWEMVTMVLCWWGAARLLRAVRGTAAEFQQAKSTAIAALTLGLMMWLVAFLSVGGEWFLMWQSKSWNGQEAAFRMFVVMSAILLLVALPESETQQ